MAFDPKTADEGPRTISSCLMLSTSTKSRLAFEKLPIENASDVATPSISVRTRLPPMPRIEKPVRPKRLPWSTMSTPGS